jgi:hypothetical protein
MALGQGLDGDWRETAGETTVLGGATAAKTTTASHSLLVK